MDDDLKSTGWVYHEEDIGPHPDIRSQAPPAGRAGKPPVCVTARIAFSRRAWATLWVVV
ncbi:MAG: hypothetical protein FalmKO_19520 [Falsiruegeria mediterranea]